MVVLLRHWWMPVGAGAPVRPRHEKGSSRLVREEPSSQQPSRRRRALADRRLTWTRQPERLARVGTTRLLLQPEARRTNGVSREVTDKGTSAR